MANISDIYDRSHRKKRLKTHLKLHYGPYQNAIFLGYCSDISFGGMYLKTELPLLINEHLSLILPLPNRTDPIACNAKVTWVNPAIRARKVALPPGVGIEFFDLSPEELLSIASYIKSSN
jgi:uncharacterized protein (TIGR02266 family)